MLDFFASNARLISRSPLLQAWGQRLASLTIVQKIAAGYGLSIGLAIVGTSIGFIVGGVSEERAVRQYQVAQTEARLLDRLENTILTLFLHPEKMLATARNPVWLRYEIGTYDSNVDRLNRGITELAQLGDREESIQSEKKSEVLAAIPQFLYRYTAWNKELWAIFDRDPELFATELVSRMTEPDWQDLQVQFERLSEDLALLRNRSDMQRDRALETWEQARRFRRWTIVLSIGLATLFAIVLAIRISQTIARPIQHLTQLAQQITEESDFTQRVTVNSHDETAQLAESIDRLVLWVRQYTDALQQARNTLEIRVQERTQDLEQAQARLVQTEKMSSLGQLVAGVAHEINNPVSFIYGNINHAQSYVDDLLGFIELYQSVYPDSHPEVTDRGEEIDLDFIKSDLPKLLDSMHYGADRIKEIVLSLRTFSRLDESCIKQADIHAGIDSTLLILGHRLKAQPNRPEIAIVRRFGEVPQFPCHAGQINQVLMNLLANAIDALEEEIDDGTLDNPTIEILTGVEGESCSIEIGNNGGPIPDDIKAKIFNPFFTTKEVGKGTGMGLAISYQIVTEKHGGSLECFSDKNGTRFVMSLPMKHATVAL